MKFAILVAVTLVAMAIGTCDANPNPENKPKWGDNGGGLRGTAPVSGYLRSLMKKGLLSRSHKLRQTGGPGAGPGGAGGAGGAGGNGGSESGGGNGGGSAAQYAYGSVVATCDILITVLKDEYENDLAFYKQHVGDFVDFYYVVAGHFVAEPFFDFCYTVNMTNQFLSENSDDMAGLLFQAFTPEDVAALQCAELEAMKNLIEVFFPEAVSGFFTLNGTFDEMFNASGPCSDFSFQQVSDVIDGYVYYASAGKRTARRGISKPKW